MKFGDRTGKIKDCYNCQYCGADMDMDACCYHPSLLKDYPWGKYLHSDMSHCLKNGNLTLWKFHE